MTRLRSKSGWAMTELSTYGMMAEFETPEQLMAAARNAVAAGYRKMDTLRLCPSTDWPRYSESDARLWRGSYWQAGSSGASAVTAFSTT